jgi:hypothetical protein
MEDHTFTTPFCDHDRMRTATTMSTMSIDDRVNDIINKTQTVLGPAGIRGPAIGDQWFEDPVVIRQGVRNHDHCMQIGSQRVYMNLFVGKLFSLYLHLYIRSYLDISA